MDNNPTETHSIDGNITNCNSHKGDNTFYNGKLQPHGRTTMNSQINKLIGTVSQASDGFPLELLSNQNFNIIYEGIRI